MKNLCKRIVSFGINTILIIFMIGCINVPEIRNNDTGTQPKTTKEIRFLAANHMWTDAIKPLIPQFEKETGIKVSLESYEENRLGQKITVEMTAGNSTIDAFMTRTFQESRLFLRNDWYELLESYVNNPDKTPKEWDWQDFMPQTVQCCIIDGKLFSIPLGYEFETLFYRKDLFEKANLKLPTTFDELEKTAKILNDPSHEVYGFVSRGKMGTAVGMLTGFLFGNGADFIKDGQCVINSPEAVKTFKYYGKVLNNYGPPGVINMSWLQAANTFASGKAAMYTDANVMYSQLVDPLHSKVIDKVGIAPFPAGSEGSHVYFTTQWGLAIPSNSKNKDEAWQFILWASSKKISRLIQMNGGSQARTSLLYDPEAISKMPDGFSEVLNGALKTSYSYGLPKMFYAAEGRDAIGEVIVKSIESGGMCNIKELAEIAAKKIDDLLAKAGENIK